MQLDAGGDARPRAEVEAQLLASRVELAGGGNAVYLEVRDLRFLETLSSVDSLMAAAERLGVTNSAVSHHLSSLERRCRTALWRRGFGEPGALTPLGASLCARAAALLAALAEAERSLPAGAGPRSTVQ